MAPVQPPIPASIHGSEMVTVVVGTNPGKQSFHVHKDLPCAVSDYFSNAFQKSFKEQFAGQISLHKECPNAFAAVYHYVYSGQVLMPAFYSKGLVPDDVQWLRTLRPVDYIGIRTLAVAVYEGLRALFPMGHLRLPSLRFIDELCDERSPPLLQRYIVAYAVYWTFGEYNAIDGEACEELFEGCPPFAVDFAVQSLKAKSRARQEGTHHPHKREEFSKDKVLPRDRRTLDESRER
jgi:hypothetical protein